MRNPKPQTLTPKPYTLDSNPCLWVEVTESVYKPSLARGGQSF